MPLLYQRSCGGGILLLQMMEHDSGFSVSSNSSINNSSSSNSSSNSNNNNTLQTGTFRYVSHIRPSSYRPSPLSIMTQSQHS